MEEDSLLDLESEAPPKLTFEEVKTIIFREPGLIKEKNDILKAMYYYCKDCKQICCLISVISQKAYSYHQVPLLANDNLFRAIIGQ
jgi:hypothetical protein